MLTPNILAGAFRRGLMRREHHWIKDSYDRKPGVWEPGPNAMWKKKSPDEMAGDLRRHKDELKPSGNKEELKSPAKAPDELKSNRRETQLAPTEPAPEAKKEVAPEAPAAPTPEAKPEAPQQAKPETPQAKPAMKSPDDLAKSLQANKPRISEPEAMKLFSSIDTDDEGFPMIATAEAKRIVRQNPNASFDDLRQEAAMKMWEVAQTVQPGREAEYPGLAQRAVQNHFASQYRAEKAKKRGEGKVGQMPEEADVAAQGSDTDRSIALREAIGRLSPEHQAIANGIMEGRSMEEIGRELGWMQGNKGDKVKVSREFDKVRKVFGSAEGYAKPPEVEHLYYEYGPRHSPPRRIEGAVARLEALMDFAKEIGKEVLTKEIEDISREFNADDLKTVAREFGISSGSTKAELVRLICEKICKE